MYIPLIASLSGQFCDRMNCKSGAGIIISNDFSIYTKHLEETEGEIVDFKHRLFFIPFHNFYKYVNDDSNRENTAFSYW